MINNEELLIKVGVIYLRYYRRILGLVIKILALLIAICFLIYGFYIDNAAAITLSYLITGVFAYIVLLDIGLDPGGEPNQSPWEQRKNSLRFLMR